MATNPPEPKRYTTKQGHGSLTPSTCGRRHYHHRCRFGTKWKAAVAEEAEEHRYCADGDWQDLVTAAVVFAEVAEEADEPNGEPHHRKHAPRCVERPADTLPDGRGHWRRDCVAHRPKAQRKLIPRPRLGHPAVLGVYPTAITALGCL